jgi:hypothetical protein
VQHPISEKVKQRNKKRQRRRDARAAAKLQMELNDLKDQMKFTNLKSEPSKVYSAAIERRKRKRAGKKERLNKTAIR